MKLLFVHDHPFRRVDGILYSTGGLNNNILNRYTSYCDSLVVVARIIDEDNVNDRWSRITDEKIHIYGNRTLKCDDLEQKIQECDKLIVRLPSFLGNKALRINKKYKKPYLIEMVGCPWDALWNHGIKGKIIAPYMLMKTKKMVKSAPYVIYVTEKFLQKRYPTFGKTIGCSDVEIVDLDTTIEENRIQKINAQNGELVIGTVAAIDVKYKGQEYVIKALGELKKRGVNRFQYKLVGNGSNAYLKGIAEQYGVSDIVHFLGGMPHEKVFEWLDSIDIYAQPSKQEGLPRAVVEAMSRGLPVIGSETGGIPELIGEECRFRANDYEVIAAILEDLNSQQLVKMSVENFKRAHDFEKSALDKKRDDFYRDFIVF